MGLFARIHSILRSLHVFFCLSPLYHMHHGTLNDQRDRSMCCCHTANFCLPNWNGPLAKSRGMSTYLTFLGLCAELRSLELLPSDLPEHLHVNRSEQSLHGNITQTILILFQPRSSTIACADILPSICHCRVNDAHRSGYLPFTLVEKANS